MTTATAPVNDNNSYLCDVDDADDVYHEDKGVNTVCRWYLALSAAACASASSCCLALRLRVQGQRRDRVAA